jgi:hypothetical protein
MQSTDGAEQARRQNPGSTKPKAQEKKNRQAPISPLLSCSSAYSKHPPNQQLPRSLLRRAQPTPPFAAAATVAPASPALLLCCDLALPLLQGVVATLERYGVLLSHRHASGLAGKLSAVEQ